MEYVLTHCLSSSDDQGKSSGALAAKKSLVEVMDQQGENSTCSSGLYRPGHVYASCRYVSGRSLYENGGWSPYDTREFNHWRSRPCFQYPSTESFGNMNSSRMRQNRRWGSRAQNPSFRSRLHDYYRDRYRSRYKSTALSPTVLALPETDASGTAANYSVTNTLPAPHQLHTTSSSPGSNRGDYGCLPRSDRLPSLRQVISANSKTLPRAQSLPDMRLQTSYEEFTPDITDEDNNESYSFQCSCPGLYQCRVTGLLFDMEGEGLVVYSNVRWNWRLLAQHHKKPAGPLFDIKCAQQSVCQLHLPHCEISSTGGCQFLSVAHVNDDNIEFITPHKITETHVIINITGFSCYGNVKDEYSPADPVQALVLLFYRPSTDPDDESLINVLLLPKNVSLQDVQRTRKKLVGNERYIETPPNCKLQPDQLYTLSTCPEDDSVHVEPTEAEFLSDNYENFFPSFQVKLKEVKKKIKLSLKHTTSSHCVWVREISLPLGPVKRSCGSIQTLFDIRSSFIDAISEPVLKSLLDHLLERKVMTDSEVESVDKMMNTRDKARLVIDTVRKKGEAASSEMIEFLCKVDPFLCEHLGLV